MLLPYKQHILGTRARTYCHSLTKCVFMAYPHTKFHMPSSRCSLVTTTRLKAKVSTSASLLLFLLLPLRTAGNQKHAVCVSYNGLTLTQTVIQICQLVQQHASIHAHSKATV